ncbi:MAG: DNA-methyltransferase [Pseudobdellovibrionaceae bacterium]
MILHGDCLVKMKELADNSVDCIVTSPPYWGLRDYGVSGQLGLEETHHKYIENLVLVFREARRVLKDEGTLWLNLGDSYNSGRNGGHSGGKNGISRTKAGPQKSGVNAPGLKPKDMVGIPWRVAFALQSDGWFLRQDIIWHKPNPMPESVRDRCTKAHEYIFLLSKSARYHFDSDAIKEATKEPRGPGNVRPNHDPGLRDGDNANTRGSLHKIGPREFRNKRSVWSVTTKGFKGAHFATFPPDLIEPCVLAGCPEGGVVLDPFFGAGTTGLVAIKNNRKYIGIELNKEYIEIAKRRIAA